MAKIARIICLVTLVPSAVSAQIVISEVMYDLEGGDTGREWIEVHNTGDTAVTVTEWKLFEGKSNHGISAFQGGDALAPGAYAIIADKPDVFLKDWTFNGQIFDSSFSLNNTGETLVLRCCGKDLVDMDSITYSSDAGAAGDGQSLHREGATLRAAKPSPGSGAIEAMPQPLPEPEPTPEPKQEAVVSMPEPTPDPVPVPASEPEPEQKQEVAVVTPEPVAQNNATLATREPAPSPKPLVAEAVSKPATPKRAQKPLTKTMPAAIVAVASDEEKPETTDAEDVPFERHSQLAAAAPSATGASWEWWLGAVGISVTGAAAAYLAGRRSRSEWKIEEAEL